MFLFRKNERLQQQEKLRGNATVLWMNAAVAPIFAAENKNWTIFGGYRFGNKELPQTTRNCRCSTVPSIMKRFWTKFRNFRKLAKVKHITC